MMCDGVTSSGSLEGVRLVSFSHQYFLLPAYDEQENSPNWR
jgi:hypothetical protein